MADEWGELEDTSGYRYDQGDEEEQVAERLSPEEEQEYIDQMGFGKEIKEEEEIEEDLNKAKIDSLLDIINQDLIFNKISTDCRDLTLLSEEELKKKKQDIERNPEKYYDVYNETFEELKYKDMFEYEFTGDLLERGISPEEALSRRITKIRHKGSEIPNCYTTDSVVKMFMKKILTMSEFNTRNSEEINFAQIYSWEDLLKEVKRKASDEIDESSKESKGSRIVEGMKGPSSEAITYKMMYEILTKFNLTTKERNKIETLFMLKRMKNLNKYDSAPLLDPRLSQRTEYEQRLIPYNYLVRERLKKEEKINNSIMRIMTDYKLEKEEVDHLVDSLEIPDYVTKELRDDIYIIRDLYSKKNDLHEPMVKAVQDLQDIGYDNL